MHCLLWIDLLLYLQENVYKSAWRISHFCILKVAFCYATDNKRKCNLFIGDWIPHPEGPVYTNDTCDWIEGHQNCMKNGRPDTAYLYWRWNPRDCELPQLNPGRFLELMRDKAWALIGDSISRNHVQSLICVLSKVKASCHNSFLPKYCCLFIFDLYFRSEDPLCLHIIYFNGKLYLCVQLRLVML